MSSPSPRNASHLRTLVAALLFAASSACAADDVGELVKDNSVFAFDLYRMLGAENGNLFFSPYSISTALAMTKAGARGKTEAQMADALHFSLPEDKLNTAFSKLDDRLDEIQKGRQVTLTTANSLWPNIGFHMLNDFVASLQKYYGASVTPVDFDQSEIARTKINDWVEQQTQGKIQNLIQPGMLDADTELVLVNAIYFYGKWLSPFPGNETVQSDFHSSPGKTVQVPMMSQEGEFPFANFDSLQVLELPYQGGALSMLLVLPKSQDGLTEVESGLSGKTLMEWESHLAKTMVNVGLPKFKFSGKTVELNTPLQKLGMIDAFNAERADFSGMDDRRNDLYISHVLHKAFIDIKEEGTEAAAATAVVMETKACLPVGVIFRADHPFLFLIQDNSTGSILFIGRVTDPTAAAD